MLNNEFNTSVHYDYDREYHCESNGCYEESICRCSLIINIRIHSINLSSLCEDIYHQLIGGQSKSNRRNSKISTILYGGKVVDKYCIYRILVALKVFDHNLWNIQTTGGYYGQEIGTVSIEDSIFEKIENHVDKILEFTTLSEKLKYCLVLEYGKLLPEFQDKNFELVTIYKNDIDFKKLNQKHIENCKQEDLSHYYSNVYVLPSGIVRKYSDTYTIIDGYHRIIANGNKALEVFLVID